MNIFTCLKEVPDRDTRYQIKTEGTGIIETDLTFEISECDEYSLEESLKLREEHGGEVVTGRGEEVADRTGCYTTGPRAECRNADPALEEAALATAEGL